MEVLKDRKFLKGEYSSIDVLLLGNLSTHRSPC